MILSLILFIYLITNVIKVSFKWCGYYINCPGWKKKNKAIINTKNDDDKRF